MNPQECNFEMEQLMNQQYNRTVAEAGEIDLGLKSFMLGTYRYMALAMAVTAGQLPFLAKDILTPRSIARKPIHSTWLCYSHSSIIW